MRGREDGYLSSSDESQESSKAVEQNQIRTDFSQVRGGAAYYDSDDEKQVNNDITESVGKMFSGTKSPFEKEAPVQNTEDKEKLVAAKLKESETTVRESMQMAIDNAKREGNLRAQERLELQVALVDSFVSEKNANNKRKMDDLEFNLDKMTVSPSSSDDERSTSSQNAVADGQKSRKRQRRSDSVDEQVPANISVNANEQRDEPSFVQQVQQQRPRAQSFQEQVRESEEAQYRPRSRSI